MLVRDIGGRPHSPMESPVHRSRRVPSLALRLTLSGLLIAPVNAATGQAAGGAAAQSATAASPPAPPPPPATKLEAFRPSAGTVSTFAYDDLGKVAFISVDAREIRDTGGATVRGVVVEVYQSEYRVERAFIDAEELPDLLKGFDALLEVKQNPTTYKNFEVRYTTKGELRLIAFNRREGDIRYAVSAGRTLVAQRTGLDATDMRKLRGLIEAAATRLAAPSK